MPAVLTKGTVDTEVNNTYLWKVALLFFCRATLVAESTFTGSLGSNNLTNCTTGFMFLWGLDQCVPFRGTCSLVLVRLQKTSLASQQSSMLL